MIGEKLINAYVFKILEYKIMTLHTINVNSSFIPNSICIKYCIKKMIAISFCSWLVLKLVANQSDFYIKGEKTAKDYTSMIEMWHLQM